MHSTKLQANSNAFIEYKMQILDQIPLNVKYATTEIDRSKRTALRLGSTKSERTVCTSFQMKGVMSA